MTGNAKSAKRNWAREVGSVLAQVFVEHPNAELTLDDVYRLAMQGGKIPREYIQGVHEKALKRAIGQILRSAKIRTADGRDARQFQSYTQMLQSEDGEEIQLHFWRDIRKMNRSQMLVAARERAANIQGAKESLLTDIEYWNGNVRAPGERQIKLEFPA